MSEHVHMNYSQITDEITLGTNMCCASHFDERLLRHGIKADISLEAEKLDHPSGISFFLWLPTIDHTAPTLDALALGVQKLRFCVSRGIKVYVPCKNGHGRAPTLVVAYFVSTGLSVKDAVKLVQKRRREIHIEPIQMARLEEFATAYRW